MVHMPKSILIFSVKFVIDVSLSSNINKMSNHLKTNYMILNLETLQMSQSYWKKMVLLFLGFISYKVDGHNISLICYEVPLTPLPLYSLSFSLSQSYNNFKPLNQALC